MCFGFLGDFFKEFDGHSWNHQLHISEPLKQTNKQTKMTFLGEHHAIHCRKLKGMNDQKGITSSQKWQSGMG